MTTPPPAWHGMSVDEVQSHLETDLAVGLSADEVSRRRSKHGLNEIREARAKSPWRILAAQFSDFMVMVLLGAALIAGILGEPGDTIAIAVIVLLNALIGFVQEFRAERALAALRQLAAHHTRVLRGGETVTVPALELVPGDVVLVEAGNQVPADIRVGEAAQLRVNESTLTGESHPTEKHTLPVEASSLGDRRSMAFKGTTVIHGRGRGIVVATGMRTELGRIAELLETRVDVKTPLQTRLTHFGKYLALVALAICGIVFAAGIARGEPVVRMFLTSISLAVAAIPEALPAVVTITLALGARRLLKLRTLVRRLPAVETLGSVTYICSDKTGTLTQNRMRVVETEVSGGAREMFYVALAVSNDASLDSQGQATGDPTEIALLEAAQTLGYEKIPLMRRWPRIAEFPFDSVRKRMTTLHSSPDGSAAFMKGAPEAVLVCCPGEDADGILRQAEQMAARGLRVLAVAHRAFETDPKKLTLAEAETSMTFLGLVGSMDPLRPEAREAVAICQRAGITPVMITGDHPATARAIAAELGIAAMSDVVITGTELAAFSNEELDGRIQNVRVYARVDPAQKVRLVEALQRRGEYVAMTGDGVNDAPALQRADIGIAMGRGGTDVAREAADLVLLDDNFATIVAAVREGRHIFDNIRKFLKFVMASNSAEIWTIFAAPFLGLPVPLLPIHILWTNLVTDGLPGLALAAEPEEPTLMQRPPRPPGENLFAHGLWQHMVWVGLLIAGLSIGSQAYAIHNGYAHWQTLVFTVLTLSQMAHVLAIRSETHSLFQLGLFSNLPLLGAVALTVGLQALVIYAPAFQRVFRTAPLTAGEWGIVAGLCSLVLLAVETEKWLVRRGRLYS
ncbi:MAG: cation-translocating P-type ATPase [Acidobacteriota bacterium]